MIYHDVDLEGFEIRRLAKTQHIVRGAYKPIVDAARNMGIDPASLEYYLGIWVLWNDEEALLTLPQDLLDLCEQLKGPHAHTILKMYRIKKGLE